MEATAREDVEDLPPSAKFVAHVLQRDGPLTTGELRDETRLAESTLREATRPGRRSCRQGPSTR